MKDKNINFLICPTVHGCAPKIDEVEKPDLNLIWTYLHSPTVTHPMGLDKVNKLPVGVTLVGQKYSDKIFFQLIDAYFNNIKSYND
jgi:Asp-tRNA(Asn)/Glu-tRNA(Gln) amidotransferase A subunit family amidase